MNSGFIIIEQMEARHLKKLILILLVVFLTACGFQDEIEPIIEEPTVVGESPIAEESLPEEQEVSISLSGRAFIASGLPGIDVSLNKFFGLQGYSIWSTYNEASISQYKEIILLYNETLSSQLPLATFGIEELLPYEMITLSKASGQRIVIVDVPARIPIQTILSQLNEEDFAIEGRYTLMTNDEWIQSLTNPVERVFYDIRNVFNFEFEEIHPIDFYVSPSSNRNVARIVYDSIYIAAGLFEPYLTGFDPISVTVLHPNDYEWYQNHVSNLDLFLYDDPWFERASQGTGGGAVFESFTGRPHMIMLFPEGVQPSPIDLDFYVHETMHIFQLGLLKGVPENRDKNLGCIYVEGGATLIGGVLNNINDELSFNYYMNSRNDRIGRLKEYYKGETDLFTALYEQVRYFPNNQCNTEYPGFGYTYGFLLSEIIIFDFGTEKFMEMHYLMDRYTISEAFVMLFDSDYDQWLREQAVPYVFELIRT